MGCSVLGDSSILGSILDRAGKFSMKGGMVHVRSRVQSISRYFCHGQPMTNIPICITRPYVLHTCRELNSAIARRKAIIGFIIIQVASAFSVLRDERKRMNQVIQIQPQ
jgi:hypothetical protein